MDASEGGAPSWDTHAAAYARLAAPCTGYIAENLFLSVAGRLPVGARILDIACGNGELARAALLHVLEEQAGGSTDGHVCAIDASEEMVARTARNLGVLGGGDLARCEVQDGQALSYASGSFDAAFSSFGIFLFPERQTGWREAARVLVSGGLFATAVWRGPEANELTRLQMEALLPALPARIREGLPRPSWLDVATPDGLAAEIRAAGFVDPEVTLFEATLTAPTPRAMWSMMQGNPLAGAVLDGCTADELAAIEDSVLTRFGERAGGADLPVRFGASCHFLVARRA